MALADMVKGEIFTGFLACTKVRVDTATNGKTYCDATLFDGQTEVLGKIWDHEPPAPIENTILKVAGLVDVYRGNKQLKVTQWRQSKPEDGVKPEEFLPVTPMDRPWLYEQLMDAIQLIEDNDYKEICSYFYSEYSPLIYEAPSAVGHHHAYLGGNMEHTLSVLETALKLPMANVNRDLLIAGALLHDIGKIKAYDWSGCSISMSRQGRLLDHIVIGLQMIAVYKENINDMDDLKFELLSHLIASHHGKLEWGSPIEPVTKEAMILHNADVMDAMLFKVDKVLDECAEGSEWTGKFKGMKNELYANTGRTDNYGLLQREACEEDKEGS